MSVATISAPRNSCASATAMQPEPVPISATRKFSLPSLLSEPLERTSTTCSVSGRGISTAGVTSNSSPQNSCLPVKYCVGTPLARCATSSINFRARRRSERRFRMRIEPRAVASKRVHQQQFRRKRIRWHAHVLKARPSRRAARSRTVTSAFNFHRRAHHAFPPPIAVVAQFLLQPFRLIISHQPVHQRPELSVHHFRQLMQRQPNAMVADAILREIVGANFLRAVAGLDLPAALRGDLLVLFFLFHFVKPRAQARAWPWRDS